LRELRRDEEGLMKLIDRDEIPEPDTVGDWLRRMGDPKTGQMGLEGLDRVRDKINERVLQKDGIKEYTLDADATEIMGEKADALFTYNGNKGYMPMLGFLYETPLCIDDEANTGGQSDRVLSCGQCFLSGSIVQSVRGRWGELCDYSRSGQSGEAADRIDCPGGMEGTGEGMRL
jgi:hypothetical protein